ncbi:MAG: hypothetical protein EZS28_038810, partial [Streblomastix strix]
MVMIHLSSVLIFQEQLRPLHPNYLMKTKFITGITSDFTILRVTVLSAISHITPGIRRSALSLLQFFLRSNIPILSDQQNNNYNRQQQHQQQSINDPHIDTLISLIGLISPQLSSELNPIPPTPSPIQKSKPYLLFIDTIQFINSSNFYKLALSPLSMTLNEKKKLSLKTNSSSSQQSKITKLTSAKKTKAHPKPYAKIMEMSKMNERLAHAQNTRMQINVHRAQIQGNIQQQQNKQSSMFTFQLPDKHKQKKNKQQSLQSFSHPIINTYNTTAAFALQSNSSNSNNSNLNNQLLIQGGDGQSGLMSEQGNVIVMSRGVVVECMERIMKYKRDNRTTKRIISVEHPAMYDYLTLKIEMSLRKLQKHDAEKKARTLSGTIAKKTLKTKEQYALLEKDGIISGKFDLHDLYQKLGHYSSQMRANALSGLTNVVRTYGNDPSFLSTY